MPMQKSFISLRYFSIARRYHYKTIKREYSVQVQVLVATPPMLALTKTSC